MQTPKTLSGLKRGVWCQHVDKYKLEVKNYKDIVMLSTNNLLFSLKDFGIKIHYKNSKFSTCKNISRYIKGCLVNPETYIIIIINKITCHIN